MTEPGWYADYQDPNRLRYHDGTNWTEHIHHGNQVQDTTAHDTTAHDTTAHDTTAHDTTAHDAPVQDASPQDNIVGPASEEPEKPEAGLGGKVASFTAIGVFAGLVIGIVLFNGIGAITPTTETTGTVARISIEFSAGTGASTSRRSHLLEGTTASGDPWRIYDKDAYEVLDREGYPQPVALAIGDWTGTPERVIGASFAIDHQTQTAKIGWWAAISVVALASLVGTYFIARSKSAGVVAAVVFFVALAGPGTWLGYQAAQWVQSG